jgi:hypothetical protein
MTTIARGGRRQSETIMKRFHTNPRGEAVAAKSVLYIATRVIPPMKRWPEIFLPEGTIVKPQFAKVVADPLGPGDIPMILATIVPTQTRGVR